jgi:guanylate kinase
MDKQLEDLLENYTPSEYAIHTVQQVTTLLMVGISGAGKNTIKSCLIESGEYHDIVSHTTRSPRKNAGVEEISGHEYHFISKQQAITMLEGKEFVEAKWVHRQNLYGTSVSEFEKCLHTHKTALADIEVQGVDEYMSISPRTVRPIFLIPPSYEVWVQRFKSRYEGCAGEGEFAERSITAQREITHVLSKYFFSIVINDDLDDTVRQVHDIARGQPQSEASLRHAYKVAQQLLDDMKHASTH